MEGDLYTAFKALLTSEAFIQLILIAIIAYLFLRFFGKIKNRVARDEGKEWYKNSEFDPDTEVQMPTSTGTARGWVSAVTGDGIIITLHNPPPGEKLSKTILWQDVKSQTASWFVVNRNSGSDPECIDKKITQ
jgi:hypothetical protein